MFSLKRIFSRRGHPLVPSLLSGVPLHAMEDRGPFEILVRHLFDRLLSSESLGAGDETEMRITQMAYAVALPGLLVALFLDPLYHSPFGPRAIWLQIDDHFFYVTYSFVAVGLGTVLQWDLLFPDQLDVFILATLPIPRLKLLLARVVALAIFLACILLGANLLGIVAFPMAADLYRSGWRLTVTHAIAVMTAGLCVSASLIALQGILTCLLGQRAARRISPLIQAVCVTLLLTTLFLCPLLSHFLETLLHSNSPAVQWFPPLWFLGLYEHLLRGSSAAPVFHRLARTGIAATLAMILLALITYPLAYTRRLRQIVEGTGVRSQRPAWSPLGSLLHRTLLRDPQRRAIFSFISQTLWRTQRLRLLLAVFGGIGVAMTAAAIILIRVGHQSFSFELSPYGIRLALPVMAFWTVAALRTASRSPISGAASWAFRIIHGRPKYEHLRAVEIWIVAGTCLVTLTTVAILHTLAPRGVHADRIPLVQAFLAIAASILLTDLFFLNERTIPFTEARPYSVTNLPFVVGTYFVLFPAFVFALVAVEPWIEATAPHILIAIAGGVAAHSILRRLKARLVKQDAARLDIAEESLRPGEMGLRG